MKKTHLFNLLIVFINFIIFSCGPTRDQAGDFSDKIIELQKAIDNQEIVFLDIIDKQYDKPELMIKSHMDFINRINISANALKGMDKFDEKNEFAESALKLFSLYDNVAKKEYAQLITLYSKEEFTEEDEDKTLQIRESIDEKLNAEIKIFKKAQEDFATKYNFELENSKMIK